MNIIGLSNIFNLISQQVGLNGYHYGYVADINRNVTNNTNVENQVGNQFPYLIFEVPSYTSTFISAIQTRVLVRLNFFDLLHYNNDSTIKTAQTIEQADNLRNIAYAFINALVVMGSSPALASVKDNFNISANSVQFDSIEAGEFNDRLLHLVASFELNITEACPSFVFDPALVLPPYSYPPSQVDDYEKIQ